MPASTARPDLIALKSAYALLRVGYDAGPLEIRKAYKRRAREHHPDQRPAGSSEHRAANDLMTAVNAAYQLVRGAPLRHYRNGSSERPGDNEFEAAIRQVQVNRTPSRTSGGVALGLIETAIVLILLPILSTAPPAAAPLLGLALVLVALLMAPTATGGSIRRSLAEAQFARLSR